MAKDVRSLDVPLKIYRARAGAPPHYDTFRVQVPATASVLDAIEVAWARHDRTLTFRHACHHASCGTCAVRVDGRERLPCITLIGDVWDGQSPLLVEPLRNFPVVGDLVVDVAGFFLRMAASGMAITRAAEPTLAEKPVQLAEGLARFNRFENCIECGICISACPTMAADGQYFGPAGLAGLYRAWQAAQDPAEAAELLARAEGKHGVWRCHNVFECTAACPQGVDPGGAIMALRAKLVAQHFKRTVSAWPYSARCRSNKRMV